MQLGDAPDKPTGDTLAWTLRNAARTHERAMLVELWAADVFRRRGQTQAARRHRNAVEREAALVEKCYRGIPETR